MMPENPRIAAVFACYNRRKAALECVERLRGQSRQPDQVVVADNASTDGTVEALGALHWAALTVLDTGENLGNAGGVRLAMERAFADGADAVWVLDDDSWPQTGALEALVAEGSRGGEVRHSLQIDPKSGRFSWPLPVRKCDGTWRSILEPDEWPGGSEVESKASWTGALYPREAWQKAGPVLAELFIRGEDEDYPRRVAAAGFRFTAVRDSILEHPPAKNLRRWRFGPKEFWFETGLEDWKFYYEVRNTVWLKLRDGSCTTAWTIGILYGVASLLFDEWSSARWRAWCLALRDARTGRLGRRDIAGNS